MSFRFTKMHGIGNDYVYVDAFAEKIADPVALAPLISDRHRGVGSDGLILVGPPAAGVAAHVRMRMFNADGSESQMCGNGIRCVAKFAYERGLARTNPLRVQTGAGVLTLELELAGDRVERVRVDMGAPILDARRIPLALDAAKVVKRPLDVADTRLELTAVSMGNPHAVFFVPDLSAVPLRTWGPLIERHPLFPERVNAHFAQVRDRGYIEMATWERGSGVTQACGTGACAVCVAGVLNELTNRQITARLPGGELELEWNADTNHVFMTGPATEVFDGVWLD